MAQFDLKTMLGPNKNIQLSELVQGAWEVHKLSKFLEEAKQMGGNIIIPDDHLVNLIRTVSGLLDSFSAALVREYANQGKNVTVDIQPDVNTLPIKYQVTQAQTVETNECLN